MLKKSSHAKSPKWRNLKWDFCLSAFRIKFRIKSQSMSKEISEGLQIAPNKTVATPELVCLKVGNNKNPIQPVVSLRNATLTRRCKRKSCWYQQKMNRYHCASHRVYSETSRSLSPQAVCLLFTSMNHVNTISWLSCLNCFI